MDFVTNPNQRRITYRKFAEKTGYTKININAAHQAMNNLSYSAFMLYSYMALNANNYEEWFSPALLVQRTYFTESTYRKAFSELLEKGYLIQDEKWKRHYTFYEGGINYTSAEQSLSKENRESEAESIPQKNKHDVLKNTTDNKVNIVEPTALKERLANEEEMTSYFINF